MYMSMIKKINRFVGKFVTRYTSLPRYIFSVQIIAKTIICQEMSCAEVTRTIKYVETFSFQAPDPLQPTLMELFTFVTKALQLLRAKLSNTVSLLY